MPTPETTSLCDRMRARAETVDSESTSKLLSDGAAEIDRLNPETTTNPPTKHIAMWDVGVCIHAGEPAWEVCIVLGSEAEAEAWRAWLQQESPGRDEING